MTQKLQFTNNALESLNGTINSLMHKGRLTPEKFGDILISIIQFYENKKLSKKRKSLLDKADTKASTLMIFLANSHLLHSENLFIKTKYLSSTLINFNLGKNYEIYLEEFNESFFLNNEESDEGDHEEKNIKTNVGYLKWGE